MNSRFEVAHQVMSLKSKKMSSATMSIGVQLVMIVLMYLGTFISYYLPIRFFSKTVNNRIDNDMNNQLKSSLDFVEEERQRRIYSNCNCIALGVFIGMCFMNVPMVNDEFRKFLNEANLQDIDYPLSELTILLGFFMVLFFEQLFIKFRASNSTPFLHLDDEMNDEQTCKLLDENQLSEGILIDQSTQSFDSSENQFNHESESRLENSEISNVERKFRSSSTSNNKFHNTFDHHHGDYHSHFNLNEFNNEINLGFFMLIASASIHSVFEGLALGLIKQLNKAINLFIGIFLHECILAFALGINASKVNKGILFGLVFSATIPFGIICGMLIGLSSGVIGKFLQALFQGLSTGTFLQVAFYELMPIELHHHQHPDKLLKKISLMFFGFLMMALIQLISN